VKHHIRGEAAKDLFDKPLTLLQLLLMLKFAFFHDGVSYPV